MKTFLGNIAPLPGNDASAHPVDVVFHLGRTKRFGGWANPEWSVLHHSMLISLLYTRHFGADGVHHALLHDAHEFISGDIPTPVKNAIGREGVEKLERYLDDIIYLGMLKVMTPGDESRSRVKACDLAALIIESFYFGDRTLDIDHIGDVNWHDLDSRFQTKVAEVVKASCPEVYTAMVKSVTMRPWGSFPEWSML